MVWYQTPLKRKKKLFPIRLQFPFFLLCSPGLGEVVKKLLPLFCRFSFGWFDFDNMNLLAY